MSEDKSKKDTENSEVSDVSESIVDEVKEVAEKVAETVEDAADAVVEGVKDLADKASAAAALAAFKTDEVLDELTGDDAQVPVETGTGEVKGMAAFFNHPDHLMYAAEQARDAEYEVFDAYSPFPIHGMDEAMGLGRSWIPWVTFAAGLTGFLTAFAMQFGLMGFDWPMNFGGRPFIAWPSFVPILFELTVLFAGVTTAFVMLYAAGCFRKPLIIDKDITNDQFVLWISAEDGKFDIDQVIEFMKNLNPHEIRAIREGHK